LASPIPGNGRPRRVRWATIMRPRQVMRGPRSSFAPETTPKQDEGGRNQTKNTTNFNGADLYPTTSNGLFAGWSPAGPTIPASV